MLRTTMYQWSNILACSWTAGKKQIAKLIVINLVKYLLTKLRSHPINWMLASTCIWGSLTKFHICILILSQGFSVLTSSISCHSDHTWILSCTVSLLLSSSSDSSSLSLSSSSSSESLSPSLSSLSSESSSLSAATSADGLTSTFKRKNIVHLRNSCLLGASSQNLHKKRTLMSLYLYCSFWCFDIWFCKKMFAVIWDKPFQTAKSFKKVFKYNNRYGLITNKHGLNIYF